MWAVDPTPDASRIISGVALRHRAATGARRRFYRSANGDVYSLCLSRAGRHFLECLRCSRRIRDGFTTPHSHHAADHPVRRGVAPLRSDEDLAARGLPADPGRHDDAQSQPGELPCADRAGGVLARRHLPKAWAKAEVGRRRHLWKTVERGPRARYWSGPGERRAAASRRLPHRMRRAGPCRWRGRSSRAIPSNSRARSARAQCPPPPPGPRDRAGG